MIKRCLVAAVVLVWLSCSRGTEDIQVIRNGRKIQYPTTDSSLNLNGQQLANIYCQQCHLFPDPELLSAEIWEKGVLPRMGHYLGIRERGRGPYERLSMMEEYLLRNASVFPDEPQINPSDWQKIREYYLGHGLSDTTTADFPSAITPLFDAHQQQLDEGISYTTMLEYDEKNKKLYIGDRRDKLMINGRPKEQRQQMPTAGPPVSKLKRASGETYLLSMGIMDPSNQAAGMLYRQYEDSLQALVGELRRPVHMLAHDLNEDGEEDLIISEFGNDIGQLSAVFLKEGRPYKKQVLIPEPGARKTMAYDWNQDGKEDLLVLMAQGDERILLLEKEKAGVYREKTLLRFPPVYGSSYFDLADFNGDGLKDILYVNGDNADYSYALKPYHGISIYLNKGDAPPVEAYFFPMHGATEAVARDFDEDGDLDIAGIAYFGNFEDQPASGAVYLENESQHGGSLIFTPTQFPKASHGRWLTMEVADIDQDGDEDILLGSCVLVRTPVPDSLKAYWEQEGTSILRLENKIK